MSRLLIGTYASCMGVEDVEENPRAAIDHAWYSWRDRTLTDLSFREIFEVGFRRGAQWGVRRSGQLSPHIAALADFLIWLNERPEEQDAWDQFVEPLPAAPVIPSTNGTGDENDPW